MGREVSQVGVWIGSGLAHSDANEATALAELVPEVVLEFEVVVGARLGVEDEGIATGSGSS